MLLGHVSVFRYVYIKKSCIAYTISINRYWFGGEKMHNNEENCCCSYPHPRMFLTKEEKITHLSKYKEWLENEAKGVDEAITKLKEA